MSKLKKWIIAEEARLLKLHEQYVSVNVVANLLDRSIASVSSKLYDLKKLECKNSGKPWSDLDLAQLKQYIDAPNDRLVKMLRRGPKEINAMKHKLRSNLKHEPRQLGASGDNGPMLDFAKIEKYCDNHHPNVANLVVNAAEAYLLCDATERQTAQLKSLGMLRE